MSERDAFGRNTDRWLELVANQLSANVIRLRFPPELETRYRHDTAAHRSRQVFTAALAGLMLFNAFSVLDLFIRPQILFDALQYRLLLATLPTVAVLFWVRSRPRVYLQDFAISLCVLLITVSANMISTIQLTQASRYDAFSFGLIVISANVLMPMRFKVAAFTSVASCAITAGFLVNATFLSPDEKLLPIVYMGAMAAMTLFANYRLELSDRNAYLMLLREKLQARQIQEQNHRLNQISKTDPLTGIANRRHFDERLDTVWAAAMEAQHSISLLMIDIDHFKLYNDAFGHPAGDDCLRMIATAIDAEIRGNLDLAARIGGEEFAVILPDASERGAKDVAGRLHRAIRRLEIPHGPNSGHDRVTISIGVSSAVPGPGNNPQYLLAAADQALYNAKRSGRNRTDTTVLRAA